MNITDNDIEQIDRYLRDELSHIEKLRLEERMKQDEGFKNFVSTQAEAIGGITEKGKQLLRKKMDRWHEDIFDAQNKVSRHKHISMYWSAAAAVAMLVTVSYLLFFNTPAQERIYSTYYQPYPDILTTRGEQNADTIMLAALEMYTAKNYEQSLMFFQIRLAQQPESDTYFYAGMCALSLNRCEEAISYLQKVSRDSRSKFYIPAQWYLALGYVRIGESAKARSILKKLIEQETSYTKNASEILEML